MRRSIRIGCFFLVGLLVTSLAMASRPATAATRHEVGIATSSTLLWMDDEARNERLRSIKRLNVEWIRIDFSWAAIQPRPDAYVWEPYDKVVQAANDHDIKILAVLGYTPAWARQPECQALVNTEPEAEKCAPRDSAEFASFAGQVAERYSRHTMRAWEIWNEPNLTGYWKSAGHGKVYVDPMVYAQVANAAAAHIRPYNPDAVILTGGLGPMFEPKHSKGMRQSDFLADILPYLQTELFHGIAVHPYSWPVLPTKAAPYNAFYTVDHGKHHLNLRTIMWRAGWGEKEIWATEYGASTKGKRAVNNLKLHKRLDHVNEEAQAEIIQQGIRHWYKKENVGPMFLHGDSDEWLAQRKNEGGFGLKRDDGTPKPAYELFRQEVSNITD